MSQNKKRIELQIFKFINYTYTHVNIPEEWMALLLFCITSINAPTIPEVGAGAGGVDSGASVTLERKVSKTE